MLDQGDVKTFGSFMDLQRGEAVNMHIRHGFLHCPGDLDVVVAVEARMNTALKRHLGRAEFGRLDATLLHILEGE